jgi:hypothetical protein
MEFEIGKWSKHSKRETYVKVLGPDWRDYIDIRYASGRKGKLIPKAPGWKEISMKEWEKVEVKVEETEED